MFFTLPKYVFVLITRTAKKCFDDFDDFDDKEDIDDLDF